MDVWATIDHLRAARFAALDQHFNALQSAYERGDIDDLKLADQFVVHAIRRVDVLPAIEAWVAAFPHSYAARQSAVSLYVRVAWEARGEAGSDATAAPRFAHMQRHFLSAQQHAQAAIALTPRPVLTLVQWSRMQMAAGSVEGAQDYTPMIESLLPHSPLLCIDRIGRLNPKWSGEAEALEQFMTTVRAGAWNDVQKNELEAAYFCERADMASCTGDVGDAIRHAEKALSFARTFQALATMAALHRSRDEFPAAIRYYDEALLRYPSSREYHFLGWAHKARDDAPAAQQAFEKALALGYGASAAPLAWLHYQAGDSATLRSHIEHWLDQGVAQYSHEAMYTRGQFFFNRHCGFPRDQQQIGYWWHEAGEWGSTDALESLALAYWDGREGFAKDYARAFSAANAAAQLGSEKIADCIGRMHYLGHGTAVDFDAAFPYLVEAAQQNQARSMGCLVRALWFGQGAPIDHDDADAWLDDLRELDPEEFARVRSEISGVIAWLRVQYATWRQRGAAQPD